jgi:hypothetical protein
MPGVPGKGGPVPKRSTQRRRRNKEGRPDVVTVPADLQAPKLTGTHSAVAKRFWEALGQSGQAQFFEPSDWAAAELVVIAIDSFVKRPSAMLLASINSAMTNLLVTEGDRRRVRLELERPTEEPDGDAEIAELDDFRRRISG